jgi:hypothetical protein
VIGAALTIQIPAARVKQIRRKQAIETDVLLEPFILPSEQFNLADKIKFSVNGAEIADQVRIRHGLPKYTASSVRPPTR